MNKGLVGECKKCNAFGHKCSCLTNRKCPRCGADGHGWCKKTWNSEGGYWEEYVRYGKWKLETDDEGDLVYRRYPTQTWSTAVAENQ